MKRIKKQELQRGAISVFLVVILIPCIVISGMFVDLSRVKLATGVATSAADLSLNSLMANYDKDLSDFYGMMASCQNIEQFYEESAQFFLESLYSQGLDADDAESLLTYVSSMFDSETVHDLFKMQVQTETKDIVKPFTNESGKEATFGDSSVIIKDQIVEFMKYRAPIEITSKIITRLKNSNAGDVFDNAKKDEPLKEAKEEYAEAEEDFMDAAFKTYKVVVEYENLGLSTSGFQAMLDDLVKARETYREITRLMVSNLNGTSELTAFYRPTYALNAYTYDEKTSGVYSRCEDGVYYIDGADITKLLKELEDNINLFKEKRDAVAETVGDTLVNATVGGTNTANYHPIQWWKKVNSLIGTPINNMSTAADNMMKSYAKVLAIKKCTLGKDIPSDWEKDYDKLTQSVTDLQKAFLTANVKEGEEGTNNNKYLRLINKLEKHSQENVNNVKPDSVKLKDGRTVTKAISDVKTSLEGYVSSLDSAIDLLKKIIDGSWGNPKSLEKLSKLAKEYNSSYNSWKSTADTTDTQMGQNDRDSIAQIEAGTPDTPAGRVSVSPQEILDFKTRCSDVLSRIESLKSTIEGMKFGDKKLTKIDSYNTCYNAVKNNIGENLTIGEVNTKSETLFKDTFVPYTSDTNAAVGSYNWTEDKYNPDFNVAQPEFHKWMHAKFVEPVEDIEKKVKDEQDKVDNQEDKGKTAADDAKNATQSDATTSKISLYKNDDYTGSEFPSGLDANGPYKLGKSLIDSVGGLIKCFVDGNFDSMRDSLYSAEYVMDMFSYRTYEKEGKYNLYKTLHDGTAPKSVAEISADTNVTEGWKSDKKTDKYNQTLTNFKINSNNNILYGAEAEYVLYGKDNEKNLKSAYADIYTIRYLLNTLSGFQNFWSPTSNTTASTIDGIAIGISSATSGIVPVAAVKCVFILLLTALETVNDLSRLNSGFPVELYKQSEDDWVISIDASMTTSDPVEKNADKGLFYSDYIYVFLCLGFNGMNDDGHPASEMYRRTADLMQVNLRKYTKDSSYSLKKSRSYFVVDATIRVDPLMLALPEAQIYSNNPKDKSDWCTFKIHEVRGYS